MERYKQIMNASHNYSKTIKRNGFDYEDMQAAFEEGAMWADEYPNKKLVYTKKELLDMGFSFDPNGNIITPQEIEKEQKYIYYQKAKWIEKACKWLLKGWYFVNSTETIDNFKQAMEE